MNWSRGPKFSVAFYFVVYLLNTIAAATSPTGVNDAKRLLDVDDDSGEFDYGFMHVHRLEDVYYDAGNSHYIRQTLPNEDDCMVECIKNKKCQVGTTHLQTNTGEVDCFMVEQDFYRERIRLIYKPNALAYVLDVRRLIYSKEILVA